MTNFVVDDFTDADGTFLVDHVGAVGATWVQHPNAANRLWIQTNRVQAEFANFSFCYASGDPTGAEYDVNATLYVRGLDSCLCGVMGRLSTVAETYYSALASTGGGGRWELHEVVNGVDTLIGTAAHTFTPGETYAMKLEIRDASKKLFVDGVAVIVDTTHNNITAKGKAGAYSINFTGGGDLSVFALADFTASEGASTSAAVTGTGGAGMTGAEVRAGAKTLIVTLTGDTFNAFDNTIRQAIIDGIVAATSPTWGWNNTRASIPTSAVVRTSATVCTITLPALPGYQSDTTETLTITVPASAVVLAAPIVATPTVAIARTVTDLSPVGDYTMSGTATLTP